MPGSAAPIVTGEPVIDVDQLPDAVLCVDADRRVTAANQAASELTGYTREELEGNRLDDLLDPRGRDGKPLLDGGWHRSTRLRSVARIPEQEVRIRRANDGHLRATVTGRYQRDRDGQLTGAVVMLRDFGRRAHLAASGIEVVSTVSHELRSPLTSVKGYTSLLLNRWERLQESQKRMMLEQVHHDADRVTRLVTELLDISRLETGRLVLRRQMIALGQVADDVVGHVRLEYPELEVEISFPPDFPDIYADPDKVEQVLTNLVENAAKYADPKGIRISGDFCTSPEEPDMVAVSVSDKGEGIPSSDLPRIFTKFFRRAETRPTGSGLGLWISRGLVEAHGGKLTATSAPGEGSTFRFTLPSKSFEELLEA
ncbi:MAG: PAS domain-containing sensor histidine kinase [Acidimicrobiia bacterium]|nr:PAS domain-containing sensor histidine kinase [Acidimicrobiia bacterium]